MALGLKNVFVSNGYMTPELLHLMMGLIHGINVDLKAGRGEFYHRISGGALEPVLANLKLIQQWDLAGGDDAGDPRPERWRRRAALGRTLLFGELGPDVPWHISRFYPQYRVSDTPPTPAATLERAWRIGRDEGLRYVYVGNVPGHDRRAGAPRAARVTERVGYQTRVRALRDGKCTQCGTVIAGVAMP